MRSPDRPAAHGRRHAVRRSRALLLSFLLAALGATRLNAAVATGERTWAPGRMFLKLRETPAAMRPQRDQGLRAALGAAFDRARPVVRHAERPQPAGLERLRVVTLPADADVPRLAAKLSRMPEVEYAEPVWVYPLAAAPAAVPRSAAAPPSAAAAAPPAPAAVPNDPAYAGGLQAYLTKIQAGSAWDHVQCETAVPRPIVCIVDGGTDWQHEDLMANLWTNPGEIAGNGIDDDGNGHIDDLHGWNFLDDNGNPRGSAATPGNANHGTLTAGLAAAVTHNGVGVASVSWNPWLMAVNASASTDGQIAYGYEGIVYAAENGAAIASCSWGGFGASLAEQDIIDFATAQGTLVLAAAGNSNTNVPFSPAAYRNVVAVANVRLDDTRYSGTSGSDYGGWLDVAAPGTDLYTTQDMGTTNSYGTNTGTSMSCPVAAGVAALIKALHPGWTPLQVGEQLRITCDDINAVNPGYVDQLGKGRVNALRAVTETDPAIRATGWTLADADGNGELNQGESVVMTLTVHDYLATASDPSYTLTSASPWVTITDGTEAGATLPSDGDATLAGAFTFTVSPDAPPGSRVDLRLGFTATGYSDFQFIPIVLEPVFETHDINNLRVSLTGTGGIGWVGIPGGFGDDGEGFSFAGGPNLLFEGALLLGTGPANLSDAARATNERTDFAPSLHSPPVKLTPGPRAPQEIHAAFSDSLNATTPLGVRVDLTSWATGTAPDDDFVIVGFDIQNLTAGAFSALWAALWLDWDIDANHYSTNRAAWDAGRRLGYAWDASPGLPYVGVMALSGDVAGYSAITNSGGAGPWGIYDGFGKAEKWDLLDGGTGVLSAGPSDISNALSTGPYSVPAGGRARAAFALLAGTSLADLQANADRASAFYSSQVVAVGPEGEPRTFVGVAELGAPSPNPSRRQSRMTLTVRAHCDLRLAVYDVRGRVVRTLLDGARDPGRYEVDWSGQDHAGRPLPSGLYFARLRAGGITQTRPLVLEE